MSEGQPQVIIDIVALTLPTGIFVDGLNTRWSKSFRLPRSASFGIELQFDSPGAVDVKVELEQGNERVDTLADAPTQMAIPKNSSGSSVGLISAGITTENTHLINFSPIVSTHARLKLTGQGANDAATRLTKGRLVFVK